MDTPDGQRRWIEHTRWKLYYHTHHTAVLKVIPHVSPCWLSFSVHGLQLHSDVPWPCFLLRQAFVTGFLSSAMYFLLSFILYRDLLFLALFVLVFIVAICSESSFVLSLLLVHFVRAL